LIATEIMQENTQLFMRDDFLMNQRSLRKNNSEILENSIVHKS